MQLLSKVLSAAQKKNPHLSVRATSLGVTSMLLAIDDVEYLLSTPAVLSLLVLLHHYQSSEQFPIGAANGFEDFLFSPPVYVIP